MGTQTQHITGSPDLDYISTSYSERQDLTMGRKPILAVELVAVLGFKRSSLRSRKFFFTA